MALAATQTTSHTRADGDTDGIDSRTARLAIDVAGVDKTYPAADRNAPAIRALDGVSLAVRAGEFVSLVGTSGCGKSTLLRIMAGLDEPSAGRVAVGEADTAHGRVGATGYLPQRDMLLPWRSVVDNVTLPLEYRGVPRGEARQRAAALLASFGLEGFERAHPAELSGGMRQRVAVARTVLTGCDTLLLDEPFGALDALTRLEMQEWLLSVWERLGTSVLLVTHDLDEAVHLSDRVYVMSARPGCIVADVTIDLPRPRPADVVSQPRFAALKGRLLAAIRQEQGTGS